METLGIEELPVLTFILFISDLTGDLFLLVFPGDQGIVGDMGPKGFPGSKGNIGKPGPVGDQAIKGSKGDTGDAGLQGIVNITLVISCNVLLIRPQRIEWEYGRQG